jgi:DNA repair protein RadA/Sms
VRRNVSPHPLVVRTPVRCSGCGVVAFGEIGLSGEIRPVPNGEERLREAATHGFRHALVPKANAPKKSRLGDLEIIGVDRLADALAAIKEM